MRVTALNVRYRGFEIGYIVGLHGYRATWRSSLDGQWYEGSIYAKGFADIPRLARECIDYQYRVEAAEAALGRKLTMSELRPDL